MGNVRYVELPDDLDQCVAGAFAFAATTELADEILEDPVGYVALFVETLKHPDVHVLVHETDGVVDAALGFSLTPLHWAPQVLHTQEMFFFNLSAGPHAALRLLRAYEREARQKGARILNLTHLETSDPRVGAVYQKMGARPSEHTFTKRLT